MLKIELVPTLSHCIETVARKEYEETVRRLLAGEHNGKLLETAELLENFLETADFKKLRSESERHLVEGKNVRFTVYWRGGVADHEMIVI